jgi:uncharacterized protein DUF6559
MIPFLSRYLARRRLRPIVTDLPRQAVAAFGASDYCTFGQAQRLIAVLRLPKSVDRYAYAAVCRASELDKNLPLSVDDYQRLRTELADLFGLRGSDFTIKDLAGKTYSRHSPAHENAYASSGDQSHSS